MIGGYKIDCILSNQSLVCTSQGSCNEFPSTNSCDGSLSAAIRHIQSAQSSSNKIELELVEERNKHRETKSLLHDYKENFKLLDSLYTTVYKKRNDLQERNYELLKENEELMKYKNGSMTDRLERIEMLDLDELNQLKNDLHGGLEIVAEERDSRMRSENSECCICMENLKKLKAICFIDGCDHVVICSQCEKQMTPQLCPLCKAPYSKTKELRI